jgi:methionyl aminopeptidase
MGPCFLLLAMNPLIEIHSDDHYVGMRAAGRLAAHVLDEIVPLMKPGVATNKVNDFCHKLILDNGAIPATLGYRGYSKSICTSPNNVICHGIPNDQPMRDGDIINVDVTVILDGWHGDTSRMYYIGKPSIRAQRLCEVAYEAMWQGIRVVKPGATIGDIGHAIQSYTESKRCSVVRDYTGHGIGRVFHAEPYVFNFGKPGDGAVLSKGMFFTIEPMVNAGKSDTILSRHDGWTVTTRDSSLSAQFEHTVAVTDDGYEIFTMSPRGYTMPPYKE